MTATISEKWKLMLRSFADIKTAIEEMGGTVSGGYNTYANGVRSIYSDTANPVTAYPVKSDDIYAYISAQITFCAAVKEEIRLAIIDGGVECDSSVPLSAYGNKIREITVKRPKFEVVNTTLPRGEARKPYEAKIEMTDGDDYEYTFEFADSSILPGGITLSSDGTISGTPTSSGYYKGIYVRITCGEESRVVQFYLRLSAMKIYVRISAPDVVYDGAPHYASYTVYDSSMNELNDVEPIIRYGNNYALSVTEVGTYPITVFAPAGYLLIEPILGDTEIKVVEG